MEDKIEVIYYQMLELSNKIDKKIEYLDTAEKNLEKITLQIQDMIKKNEAAKIAILAAAEIEG